MVVNQKRKQVMYRQSAIYSHCLCEIFFFFFLIWKYFHCAEEKILAIEEIRREESKSKMLLAEAMAAGI